MQKINQKDLKKGMLVVDVDSIEIGDLFEVVKECTETQSLGLRLKSNNDFYERIVDDNGLNKFGKDLIYGEIDWYIPTAEEIELIKSRDKND